MGYVVYLLIIKDLLCFVPHSVAHILLRNNNLTKDEYQGGVKSAP